MITDIECYLCRETIMTANEVRELRIDTMLELAIDCPDLPAYRKILEKMSDNRLWDWSFECVELPTECEEWDACMDRANKRQVDIVLS